MIISLTVTNWTSFKDETKWLLVPSKSKSHRERIPKIGKLHISPIAALFGPNASGKTNLLSALEFIQKLVLKGPANLQEKSTEVMPYLLSGDPTYPPTTFALEMLINEQVYELTISLTRDRIIEEALSLITPKDTICLYHRQHDPTDNTQGDTTTFHPHQPHHRTAIDELRRIADRTHPLRLFLTKSAEENIPDYQPIIKWFSKLAILTTNAVFKRKEWLMESTSLSEKVSDWLRELDTGIVRLDKEQDPDLTSLLAQELKNDSSFNHELDSILDKFDVAMLQTPGVMIERTHNDGFTASKLSAIHQSDRGQDVAFGLDLLSEGSRWLIEFLPAIVMMMNQSMVVVVDELDRHFHSELTCALLAAYLRHCTPATRSQLIFTTHNQSVMDQSLLRLDEMWLVEKRKNQSHLCSCVDFKGLHANTDVAKRYRQGYLGAYPTIDGLPYGGDEG